MFGAIFWTLRGPSSTERKSSRAYRVRSIMIRRSSNEDVSWFYKFDLIQFFFFSWSNYYGRFVWFGPNSKRERDGESLWWCFGPCTPQVVSQQKWISMKRTLIYHLFLEHLTRYFMLLRTCHFSIKNLDKHKNRERMVF
jgi:hypothetical protein